MIAEELQLAKDFIKRSILTSAKRQLLLPRYDKTNSSHIVLFKAIEELKNEGSIIITKLSEDRTIITLKK